MSDIKFEPLDMYQYGACASLEEAARIIAAHKEERPTYTADEIVEYLLNIAKGLK